MTSTGVKATYEDAFKNYLFNFSNVSSIDAVARLEELVELCERLKQLQELRSFLKRIELVVKTRGAPTSDWICNNGKLISDRKTPIKEHLEKIKNKIEEKELIFSETEKLIEDEGFSTTNSVDVIVLKFFSEISPRKKYNFLKKCESINLPFNEWKVGYQEKSNRSESLKRFFVKKMEESAQNTCDYIFLFAVSSSIEKREELFFKIKPFIEDEKSWQKIKRSCLEDKYLKRQIPIDYLIGAIENLRQS
jgi:hypothetical protein